MTIDPKTGLPELPEGHFWRVKMGSLSINHLELRKKAWYGSRKLHDRALFYYDRNKNVLDPAGEIERAATSIMNEFIDPWTDYYGDYPPKKLEG